MTVGFKSESASRPSFVIEDDMTADEFGDPDAIDVAHELEVQHELSTATVRHVLNVGLELAKRLDREAAVRHEHDDRPVAVLVDRHCSG